MDETYRMLGREHEADLEREAARRRLAAELPLRRLRMPSVFTQAASALGALQHRLRRPGVAQMDARP